MLSCSHMSSSDISIYKLQDGPKDSGIIKEGADTNKIMEKKIIYIIHNIYIYIIARLI